MRLRCPGDHEQRDQRPVSVHQPGVRHRCDVWYLCVGRSFRWEASQNILTNILISYIAKISIHSFIFLLNNRHTSTSLNFLSNSHWSVSFPFNATKSNTTHNTPLLLGLDYQTHLCIHPLKGPTWTLLWPSACASWADIPGPSSLSMPSSSWWEPSWLQPPSRWCTTVSQISYFIPSEQNSWANVIKLDLTGSFPAGVHGGK